MKSAASYYFSVPACIVLSFGVAVLAAGTGLAFAGWMEHAPAILMTLTTQGLAWCF